jgi:parallel beta-helix repeat protein
MTVNTTPVETNYTGNASTTVFALTFAFAANAHVKVYLADVLQNSGYSITGAGNPSGGTLTFSAAPGSGVAIKARRVTPLTQEIDVVNNATVFASSLETGLDYALMRQQEEAFDRAALGVSVAADAVQTAADRVQTGLDRVQTGLDRVATAADRVQTGLDRVQTGLDAVATAADRAATADKVAASALAAGSGASLVGYQRSATGALTRTLDTLLRENVYDYEFYTPDATPLPDATPQDAAYQNFINAAVGKNAVHTGFVTITGGSSDSTTLGGGAWTVFKSPITIPSNTHIVFQDRDSGVQCATSSLSNGAVFQLHAVSNVSFSGPGRIIGDRVTHTGVGGESLMGIVVAGSSKVTIKDVHISNFWGDGILLGYDRLGNPCSNVVIDSVICDNNRRQGMSVTAGTEVDVTNSGFINTNGTAPQAGVDIEPDPGKNVSHIRFANCYFNGNAGDGFQVAPQNGTFVRGVMVTNCSALSNGRDGFFWGGDGSTPGEGGQFTNCFARLNTEAGFRLSGKYTQLSNCHAFNNGTSGYRFRGEFTSLRLNSGASTGNFTAPVHTLSGITAGETVTGGTSGATATVKYWNSVSKNMVATSISGTFVTGETITGGTSGATMVVRSVLTETASSFNTLTNCTARDNTAHGFYMETTSEHNKLVGCFAIGNSTGFRVITDYNVFEACSSLFNIGSGFSINSGADNNVISGGAASGNESSGVSIAGTGNTVRGMVLRHLGLQGTGISVTSTTGYNLIEGNDCYLSSRFSSDLVLTDTTTISRDNRNIQNHPHLSSGTNTPEAAVTAPIGSLFQRTNGSNGTSLYIKESGTGNTGWRPLAGYLSGSATYDAPSLLTLATTTTTVTVTGAAVGDFAECSFGVSLAGMIASAYVSAADTVTVVLFNATIGTVDLASTTLRAHVRKA